MMKIITYLPGYMFLEQLPTAMNEVAIRHERSRSNSNVPNTLMAQEP
jgi:hypothetical protein